MFPNLLQLKKGTENYTADPDPTIPFELEWSLYRHFRTTLATHLIGFQLGWFQSGEAASQKGRSKIRFTIMGTSTGDNIPDPQVSSKIDPLAAKW